MKKKWIIITGFVLLFAAVIAQGLNQSASAAASKETNVWIAEKPSPETFSPPTNQIIIKYNDTSEMAADSPARLTQLSQKAGIQLAYSRDMSGGAHVYELPTPVPVSDIDALALKLEALPDVAYAEPDRILHIGDRPQQTILAPNLIPNDTRYNEQWHYIYAANTSEGLNLQPAWDIITGTGNTVVAVIDTGILLGHTDLTGKLVQGYDFIVDIPTANDGDGRDSDPSDPGDWTNVNECFSGWPGSPSSWHGTHVGGTIGAATNNNLGVAGVSWNTRLLPVRVLGKCGGFTSDIIDGMRWSAGIVVPGVPTNTNPAKVLNLSLGGGGACSASQQTAIDDIVNAGSVVVVAAGNENQDASNVNPANCNNVITVAANDRGGDKASYSNFGSVVEVTAPGGETATITNGVLSTLDSGTTTPANDNAYAFYQGTSMATPHVAGLVSLMLDYDPTLMPGQASALLQSSARPFPSGSSCNTSICGAGIVDAERVLNAMNNSGNVIANPGFEDGRTDWTEFSSNGFILIFDDSILPVTPHNGSWAAWLAGEVDEVSYIEQNITVPISNTTLSYWHWIVSQESNCANDLAGVIINGNVSPSADIYPLCVGTETGGWVQHFVDLSTYAGQNISLRIQAQTDTNSLISHLFVDDFLFQAGASNPITDTLTNSAITGTVGSTVIHDLTFTNIGSSEAFTLTAGQYTWPTTLLTTSPLSVLQGMTATISIQVDIPLTVYGGDMDSFVLQAESTSQPGVVITGTGATSIPVVADLAASGNSSQSGFPGESITYTVAITNQGNLTDTFDLTMGVSNWPVTSTVTAVGPLAPDSTIPVEIVVSVGSGTDDSVNVTFTSTNDSAVSQTVTLVTNALREYQIYLPAIQKPIPCFKVCWDDGPERNPNNSRDAADANGLLCDGVTISGVFDDQSDYYAMQTGTDGVIDISLTGYTGNDAQILLLYQGNLVTQGVTPDYHIQHIGPAGQYHIRVFIPIANNIKYFLNVNFP
ncbi:MAG: S8 family serine peptidase [Chloroflexi bacterium]|nr:S8 family serine peptidase [Chloroflexota bacterium]